MPSDARSQNRRSPTRGRNKTGDRRRDDAASHRGADVATCAAIALLALATIAAYSNSLRCPFVFDDVHDIVDNRSIRSLWPLGPVFTVESASGRFLHSRPVVNFSLAVNYAIGGLDTFSYHLANLTVHVLAGLTLFGIVRRTLALPSLAESYGTAATPLAFVIAGIWMLHPLQTEAVTYIVQRYESMMGLFYLLSLYCVLRGDSSLRARWWNVGAVAACLLAMGSKEVAVSIPLVILLYDRAFLAGSFGEAWRRRRGLYLGLVGAWLVLGLHLAVSGGRGDWAGFQLPVSPMEHARSQFGVILHYLGLSFWPDPLVFDYNWPVANTLDDILPGAVVVLGLLAATTYALVRWPKWGLLGAWFFLILAPTSSIMPIADLAFEHRMYLSLAAVAAAVVVGAHAAWTRLPKQSRTAAPAWGAAVVALPILVALGATTYARNQTYASERALWTDVMEKAPDNPRAYYNLGQIAHREGNTDEATALYRQALRLEPRHFLAHTNLANLLYGQGKVDEAIHHYEQSLDINPKLAEPHFNLGNILRRQGKVAEAAAHYEAALAADPQFAEAHTNLANILYRQGRIDEAVARYRKAMESNPGSAQARTNLAIALLTRGEIDEAIAQCQDALKLNPQSPEAHCELGKALYRKGRSREALAHWLETIRLRPQDLATVNVVARLLATSPDDSLRNGVEAVKLAEHAVRLSDAQVPALLDTLAAAYAEAGRFPDAVEAAKRALRLASANKDAALAEALRARVRLYEEGSPYRDARPPLEATDQDRRAHLPGK